MPATTSTLRTAAGRGRLLRADLERASVVWLQRLFDRNSISALGLVRRHRPNLRLRPGSAVVVTRREDVLAVLADSDTFAPSYRSRLPGPFLLGLEGAEYDRQLGEIRAAFRTDDLVPLQASAAATAREHVVRGAGSLDLGADLVHPVLDRVVADYLGVPGPDPDTQWSWARDIFEDIFLNSLELDAIRAQAQVAAGQMSEHVDSLIAARKQQPDAADDDVLARLLERQRLDPTTALDDREIRESLIGLAIGWLWHGARTALIVMDELLNRPPALEQAQRAARADDLDGLRQVLWEILRFRPVQLGLLRTCQRDTVIAAGTPRARRVPAGAAVVVGTHSAMWDETAIPTPDAFDTTRADDQYLIFGRSMHRCLGEAIIRVQLPAMLTPILAVDGLRRADGPAGKLRWAGPRPDALCVRFLRP